MASLILCYWCKEHLVVFSLMQMVVHYLSLFTGGCDCLLHPGFKVSVDCLLSLTDFPGDSLQLGERMGRHMPVG